MTSTKALQELLPCPFCGGPAEHIHIYAGEEIIDCADRCAVRPSLARETYEWAARDWNRRVSLASATGGQGEPIAWRYTRTDNGDTFVSQGRWPEPLGVWSETPLYPPLPAADLDAIRRAADMVREYHALMIEKVPGSEIERWHYGPECDDIAAQLEAIAGGGNQ